MRTRTKLLGEIRAGVVMAKRQIAFYEEFGHVLLMPTWDLTELGYRAYKRVADIYAINQIYNSMARVIKTIDDNKEFLHGESHPGRTD